LEIRAYQRVGKNSPEHIESELEIEKKTMFPDGIPLSKRIFDLMLAIFGSIILWPIIFAISVTIWIIQGRPILFSQTRPGFKGHPFRIYKFRTMLDTHDLDGNLSPDEKRITKFGHFLRSSSLDELPEIVNIFKGEMSWVGPRPMLMEYLPLYSPEQARRHDVLPGVTGWAQVNGRNVISWSDKFLYDVWYVDNWSFGLDMKILRLSLVKVMKREGISQPGHATSEKFTGNQD